VNSTFFPETGIGLETLVEGRLSRRIKAHAGRLMMVEVHFENGAEGAAHEHPHEQATYCLVGEFEFTVGEETRVLRPGDSVYIRGGQRHGTKCLAKGRLLDVFTPQREDFLGTKERP